MVIIYFSCIIRFLFRLHKQETIHQFVASHIGLEYLIKIKYVFYKFIGVFGTENQINYLLVSEKIEYWT